MGMEIYSDQRDRPWRGLSEALVERENCGWDCGLTPSMDACIEENTAFWSYLSLFNAA